jgi:hypothetical protein
MPKDPVLFGKALALTAEVQLYQRDAQIADFTARTAALRLETEAAAANELLAVYQLRARIAEIEGRVDDELALDESALELAKRRPALSWLVERLAVVRVAKLVRAGRFEQVRDVAQRYNLTFRSLGTPGPQKTKATAQTCTPEHSSLESPVARTVGDMRSGFRHCYQQHLNSNPYAEGTSALLLELDASGAVNYALIASRKLAPELLNCVVVRAAAGAFEPPEGGSAKVQIPMTFVRH